MEKNWGSEISQKSSKSRGSRGKECSIASQAAHIMGNVKTYKQPLFLAK